MRIRSASWRTGAALGAATLLTQPLAWAQQDGSIEEMVVTGRYRAAATDVTSERIDSAVAVDYLDAAGISRVGDSDVAAALRRVPGLTVVNDKFVYVRGLGERYSSAQLNGAAVPSPDLTRSVLPLDIFPAEIVDALAIHKGYSPEMPAAFGGGNVNIRTKKVPEGPVFSITAKSGWNSESSDDGWTYSGGGDDKWGEDDGTRAMPDGIANAIQTFQGSFSPTNILATLQHDGEPHDFEEAQAVNRELATALNRNVDLERKSMDPDFEAAIVGGYRWTFGERWEIGFLAQGSYANEWRNRERINRFIVNPTTNYQETQRSVNSVDITGSLNLGLRFTDDHEIGTVSMALRNTEDEASSAIACQQGQFNDCADHRQERIYDIRYEERDLRVNQVFGDHTLGDATLDLLPDFLGFAEHLRDSKVSWYYSDATAVSDVPNEVRVGAVETLDPLTGEVLTSRVRQTGSAAEFRFSDLDDEVESYGYDVTVPLYFDRFELTLSGGQDVVRKARDYRQISMGLGSTAPGFLDVNTGTPSEVFSDSNILDPNSGIELLLGIGGFGTESYFAGQITDAAYGKFDFLLDDTWRISGGVRWEDFRQLSVPVDLLDFDGSRIPLTPEQIRDAAINEDDWYPALALTYIRPDFWAEEFQLRLGWSETVVRPDLREISQSTYIDPLTEVRVRGNPTLEPADITNYDLRAEWFWGNGDSAAVSLFYKEIDRPIETVQGGATEDDLLFNFVNADTAEVYGIELEWLKGLGFASSWLGGWTEAFYLAGNLTLSDSEIDIPTVAGVGNITNDTRPLTQQSDWVANLQLGYDAPNGRHGATLVYNAFGERIFFAGIDGYDDAYEQPFHSLDLVYSWFPTENVTMKFRVKNLLNESLEIEQEGVKLLEQEIGTTALVDLKWEI